MEVVFRSIFLAFGRIFAECESWVGGNFVRLEV